MPFAVFVVGIADAEFQDVVTGGKVGGEHDRSWIMQTLAEPVEEVDFLECSAVDTGFDDSGVRAGDNLSTDCLAVEVDRCFRAGLGAAKERNVCEALSLAAGNVLPVGLVNFPAAVG